MSTQAQSSSKNTVPVVLAATLALTLASCGKSSLQGHRQLRRQAPQSANSVGFVVRGASEASVAEVLDRHPAAEARVINSAHGIYEVFNVADSELRAQLPSAKVDRNQFFQTLEKKALPSVGERMNMLADAPAPTQGEKLEQCEEDAKSPEAVLDIASASEDITDQVMDLGGEFSLTSAKSTAHPDHPSALRVGWLVMAPTGSKKPKQIFFQNSIQVKPDVYGMYSILMVVQDARKVCAGTSFDIIVTGNKDFVGHDVNVDEVLKKIDRKIFTHLPEIHAEEAQAAAQGEGVLIAVIDTGVNYNHAALLKNTWTNTKEIAGNKLDDDGNGQVDDVVGWDFTNGDNSPYDDVGHGSHVAGLAASSFFGLAPKAQVMAVKALGPAGGDIASVIGAIYYAIDGGAKILNMSLGNYGPPHPGLVQAMDYAEQKGVLVLAAAGNGHPTLGTGLDTDKIANFPSALPHDNIIAIAAKDTKNLLAPYSNYGVRTVDVAAPGGNAPESVIMSAFLDNPDGVAFIGMSGTSMATPIVSGVTALVLSANPKLSVKEVKRILMTSGPAAPGLEKLVQSGRYVDALGAVQAAKPLAVTAVQ